MYRLLPTLVLLVVAGLLAGCDAFSEDDSLNTAGLVALNGQVLNADTDAPVAGAFLRVLPLDLVFETDTDGRYDVDVEIDSTMDLTVVAEKEGFSQESQPVLAVAGRTVSVPTFRLVPFVEATATSGQPSNILLGQQSTTKIGVRESGSEEVASLTFIVADSLGQPVTLDNATEVNFSLGVEPGGDAFIYPASARTNNKGEVQVNVSSGTQAGVVQVIATAQVDGRTIRSKPVALTIHGGLPDQDHFSLGPQVFNFPGLRFFNITNPMTVLVGDKYGNPVRPGTAVYFTTTHGLIEGSVETDAQGGGSVNLISGNPLPADGIATITATTADENNNPVSAQTPVVFSGVPVVRVSPGTAQLGQTYSLTVTDPNGNPLVAGTTIDVAAEGTQVKAVGNTSVTLDDTAFIGGNAYENVLRGPGVTEFTFSAVADPIEDSTESPSLQTITVTVSGGNGSIEIVLGAGGTVATRTDGATIEQRADGTIVATAPDEVR